MYDRLFCTGKNILSALMTIPAHGLGVTIAADVGFGQWASFFLKPFHFALFIF
jgi:hypothetical protein